MKVAKLLLAAVLLFASSVSFGVEPMPASTLPAQAVQLFYQFHFHHDMGFTQKNLKAREKWIDAGLYDLLSKELKKPQKPDEVPDVDGDPFTCSQEYPNAIRVTKSTESGETADVGVVFEWPKGGNPPRPANVQLRKDPKAGTWKISNIVLSDGYDLAKELKQNLSVK